MGTLTANVERLPGFCDHKLPTSCRLTSIPQCCACADERAHAPSYSTYIDGIGFVPRGKRWQRYCWFCKEFWENRVAATDLRPAQTRIPEVPDQSDFLQKWYDFHRGYRLIRNQDGSEERVAVLGEPMADVSPGHLPRTLDELRAGRQRTEADPQQHFNLSDHLSEDGPSLDSELDRMFEAAAAEERALQSAPPPPSPPAPTLRASSDQHTRPTNVAGQAMQATRSRNQEYQNRRIAALRRELQRMRNGIERVISGLRDLGEFVPDPTEATGRLISLGRTLDEMEGPTSARTDALRESPAPAVGAVYRDPSLINVQQRLDVAQAQLEQAQRFRDQSYRELDAARIAFDEARQNREEAADVLDGADLDLREHRAQISQLRREQRTAENYFRVFGSREEMDNQGSDYVSPIGSMFTRAWQRFRVAEEVRLEERTLSQILHDEQMAPAQEAFPDNEDTVTEAQLEEYYYLLRSQDQTQSASQNVPGHVSADVATHDNSPGTSLVSRPPNRLEHLLRNTPEPERSAIIARMRENGTAQVLEESTSHDIFNSYQRLGATRGSFGSRQSADIFESEEEEDPSPAQGLDTEDSGRPDPKEDEEMIMKLDCKVCYSQVADTACLPCGHLAMCQWCSEQHSPVKQHDRTRPQRPTNCPVCRKRVKQKVRIYRP